MASCYLESMKGNETMTKNLDTFAHDYRAGNAAAFAPIYEALQPVAAGKARRFQTHGLEREDLEQEALAAIVEALAKWDPSKGAPFEAYARNCMEWAVRNAHRKAKNHDKRAVWSDTPETFAHGDASGAELAASALVAACKDDTDRAVLEGLTRGTPAEVAAELGITKQAVSLRVVAIKERFDK
jgi:RNA polymerase sigma factor (sigma-70 family)